MLYLYTNRKNKHIMKTEKKLNNCVGLCTYIYLYFKYMFNNKVYVFYTELINL